MAKLALEWAEEGPGWRFTVTVSEGGSETRHRVTLARADRERLAPGLPPEELVRRSFEFLLAREAKEAILSSFELTVISRYFPDFEETLRRTT